MATLTAAPWTRCRLCKSKLAGDPGADLVVGICGGSCKDRPEAKRLRATGSNGTTLKSDAAVAARAFTPAEKSLIKSLHGYMSAVQLLEILNERLVADLGPDVAAYTLEQLGAAVQGLVDPAQGPDDWAGLRRLLARARRDGLLEQITPTVIADFAVVFQLSTAQAMHVKDVIEHARRGA